MDLNSMSDEQKKVLYLEEISKILRQMEADNRIFYYCLLESLSTEIADEFRYRLETINKGV